MPTWKEIPLGELIELQRGYDLPERDRRDGNVPVCGSAGINGYHDTARASRPGVTIGRSGASVGVVTFINEPYWPHNTALFVKDFKGNDPRFVAALLTRLPLADLNSGSAQPSLNRNFLYPIKVRQPPLDIQRRIAGILSAYDDLIEVNTRRIAVLEEMARRLFEGWFTKADSGAKVSERRRVVPAERLIEFDPPTRVLRDGDKPFVPMTALSTTSMIINGVQQRSGNSGSKFQRGDTLFARITPCLENGKTGFVSFLAVGQVGVGSTEFIVLRGRTVSPEWVYLLARSEQFRAHAIKSMSGATGRQRVRQESLKNFPVAEPDGDTMSRFTMVVRPIFELVHTLASANVRLRSTRDLLLPKLISGEIDLEEAKREVEAKWVAAE